MDEQREPEVQEASEQRLDPFEIRVLAVLAEKEALTPDNYPLSMNTLVAGCNQLSSRDPVMSMQDETVQQTLQRLIEKKLVNEVRQAGARVPKYEHRLRIKWALPQDKLAILATLMLRGPQTAGEVRARSGRLHEFSSVADVEAGLQFLIDKYPPLVARLARAPSSKESRYLHLLGDAGEVERQETAAALSAQPLPADRVARLESEVVELRQQLEQLEEQFAQFRRQFE
ncbi:MAG: YceH family protein [Burkholderiaceae bacterium]